MILAYAEGAAMWLVDSRAVPMRLHGGHPVRAIPRWSSYADISWIVSIASIVSMVFIASIASIVSIPVSITPQ